MRIAVSVALVLIGTAAVVAGGADDSPGLQGLGLLTIIGAVLVGMRSARRTRRRARQ